MTDQAAKIAGTCLMQAVRRASRSVTATYERALAEIGLSAGQFTLMTALAVAPADSKAALARRISADRTTVSRLLGPLTRRGLVGPGDTPGSLALTDAGAALYGAALPRWEAAQADALAQLGAADAATLRTLLNRF